MGHSETIHPSYSENDPDILQMDQTQAIEVIMDAYGDEIKRLIYTYVKNTADTDDVTQDVFVTVYQKLHTFKGKSSLRSWVYSIAINKSKDYLRSWHARNRRLKEKLTQFSYASQETNFSPEDYMVQKNEASQLLDHVMNLPIKYREIIVLYYLKDLSTKEIAHVLATKEATVRTRLNRGRDKLKMLLLTERGGKHG